MNKIKAFFTAVALFVVFVIVFHAVSLTTGIKTSSPGFGTWYNPYKDLSYNALSQNMGDDSMMVFGSSEFRHERNTPFHPSKFFRGSNVELMTVGGPFNQTLFHTIALGSMDPYIKNRKVVLILSPTWFKGRGVSKEAFSLRFSKTEYMAFMENSNIPVSIKKYVADRSETLLKDDSKLKSYIRICNNVRVRGKKDFVDRSLYNLNRIYATDADYITTKTAMTFMGRKELRPKNDPKGLLSKEGKNCDWNRIEEVAKKNSAANSHNRFNMSDKSWNSKFKSLSKTMEGKNANIDWADSKEYDDLRVFLELCKACKIEPMLIVLPVNGYWYDYTGATKDKRSAVPERVKAMSKEYGVRVEDLTKYDYKKYVMSDAVHPTEEGWVKINEKINSYYNED